MSAELEAEVARLKTELAALQATEDYDNAALQAENEKLRAQVARWEDREVDRASYCSANEEHAKKLAKALLDTYHAGDANGVKCWCVYLQLVHPVDDPQDAVELEGDTGHTKECNFARAALDEYLKWHPQPGGDK